MLILLILISVLPVYNLVVVIYNLFTPVTLKPAEHKFNSALVSVLIPVRNEEHNIGELIDCLLVQSYQNIEVIILDDFSDDNTLSICRKYSEKDERIKVVQGKDLPTGWLGKNWACYQLSETANGKYFLFLDADVRLADKAVEASVCELINSHADVLTVYPFQRMISIGEKLCVGALNWYFYSCLFIAKVYRSKNKNISAAVGQFMLWKKEIYLQSGGHQSVKDKIVEDIELGKFLKRNGYKVNLLRGGELISCRMYDSFKNAVDGFTKNAYPSTNDSPILFFTFLIVLSASYLLPLLFINDPLYLTLLIIILIQRFVVSILSGTNVVFELLTYPVQIIVMTYIGIRSFVFFKKKKLQWKERILDT